MKGYVHVTAATLWMKGVEKNATSAFAGSTRVNQSQMGFFFIIIIIVFLRWKDKRDRKFYPNTKHLKLNNSNWASHHKSKAWPGSVRFEKREGEKKNRLKKCKQPIRLRTHFYPSFFILTRDLTSIYLVNPTRGDNPLESNGDWRTIVPNHSHWWLDCAAVRTRVSKGAQYLASSWKCLSRRGAHGRDRWQDMCPHSGILRDGLVRKREKLGKSPVRRRGGDTEWGRDRGREGVGTDCRTNPHSSRLL